jgi:hypothetical protein
MQIMRLVRYKCLLFLNDSLSLLVLLCVLGGRHRGGLPELDNVDDIFEEANCKAADRHPGS